MEKYLDIESPFEETLQEINDLESRCNQLVEKSKDIVEF